MKLVLRFSIRSETSGKLKNCWQSHIMSGKATPLIMSLMYKANRYGDKTPPCRIPRNKQYASEIVEHHRTHVIQVLNQFSITHNKFTGTFLCINFKNKPWWFILSQAFEMSIAHRLTVILRAAKCGYNWNSY